MSRYNYQREKTFQLSLYHGNPCSICRPTSRPPRDCWVSLAIRVIHGQVGTWKVIRGGESEVWPQRSSRPHGTKPFQCLLGSQGPFLSSSSFFFAHIFLQHRHTISNCLCKSRRYWSPTSQSPRAALQDSLIKPNGDPHALKLLLELILVSPRLNVALVSAAEPAHPQAERSSNRAQLDLSTSSAVRKHHVGGKHGERSAVCTPVCHPCSGVPCFMHSVTGYLARFRARHSASHPQSALSKRLDLAVLDLGYAGNTCAGSGAIYKSEK